MKYQKSMFLIIGLLMCSIMLAACGRPPASVPTGTPEPLPSATLPPPSDNDFPTGRFIQSGSEDYGLLFNEDGTFSVFSGNTTFVRGTYTVDGNTFTETSNDGGCNTNVSFTYTFDGTNLTFNYVGDPEQDASCDGRYADFNNVTYMLSE